MLPSISYGIEAKQEGNTLTFSLDRPRYLSVGVRTNLETLDILSNALYLYFNFSFKLKLSHGCDFGIVLGISDSIHLEGISVYVLPFAAAGAGFYLKVFLEFDAGWSLGYYQTVIRRRMPLGCHR